MFSLNCVSVNNPDSVPCDDMECTNCCGSRGFCRNKIIEGTTQREICNPSSGFINDPESIDNECNNTICLESECCNRLGQCSSDDCEGTIRTMKDPSELNYCNSIECSKEECCDNLPFCQDFNFCRDLRGIDSSKEN